MTDLQHVIRDFAWAFKELDSMAPRGRFKEREYLPGIGPLTEADVIGRSLEVLREQKPDLYSEAGPKAYPGDRRKCDLVLPGTWAVEFKLIRPFGDNGVQAEHWSENVLHPYPGNVSAIGDCIKLIRSEFLERKAVVVFGYEHCPPQIPLEPAVRGFEILAEHVVGIHLGERISQPLRGLIHSVHQQGWIYGWEVLGFLGGASN